MCCLAQLLVLVGCTFHELELARAQLYDSSVTQQGYVVSAAASVGALQSIRCVHNIIVYLFTRNTCHSHLLCCCFNFSLYQLVTNNVEYPNCFKSTVGLYTVYNNEICPSALAFLNWAQQDDTPKRMLSFLFFDTRREPFLLNFVLI